MVTEAPEDDSGSRSRLIQAGAVGSGRRVFASGAAGSRRRLLQSGAAGVAGALLVTACGKESLHDQLKHDPPVARIDVEVLEHLIVVERLGITAYTAGAPLLPPSAARAAKQFLAQDLAHVGGLSGLIRAAGAKPPEPQDVYDLGMPRNSQDVLRLLHQVERAQISAYLSAIPRLGPGPVRRQVAGYFANDAQHVSILRFLLGEAPLPDPLVTGRE